nr:DNA topoisomerase 2 [Tanacetum cinerariifolium]
MPEYEAWKENFGNKATEYKINESKEGAEYFADLDHHMKDFVWADDKDGDAIELAFSKKKIEERKKWLRALQAGTYFDSKETHIPYHDFINKELILFSMADLQRSIASMVDGLKPGQRKILFCAFKKPIIQEIKVAQFSGYVSEHSAYHHGEASLVGTIIGMAQNYVGSNNINLLQPNGQFGTRQMGGKDHASGRYIFTQLSPITRHIFHKADELLLNYLFELVVIMILFLFDKEDNIKGNKEFLEAAAQEGEDKIPFIKDYTAHNDDTTMHFEIIMIEDQMKTTRQEGFLKKFKQTTTLSTSNMHLFDANGVIKSTTPRSILHELGKASFLLENKVRFIHEVVEGTIVVRNKKKDDLYAELKVKGFTPLPKETVLEASIAGAVDHVGREASCRKGRNRKGGRVGSWRRKTTRKYAEVRDAKKKEFDELTNTLSKSLWIRYLDALDHHLDEQDKSDAKDEEDRRKQQEKARAKGSRGGRKARKPVRKPAAKKATVTPIEAEPMETSGSSTMERIKHACSYLYVLLQDMQARLTGKSVVQFS